MPFYEKAVDLGLPPQEMQKAILGLGSSYRALGEYEKSKTVFQKGIELFPENRAIPVFYSMTLYNLQEHRRAMELLLKCLIETTHDHEIMGYKKAIAFLRGQIGRNMGLTPRHFHPEAAADTCRGNTRCWQRTRTPNHP